MNNSNNSRVGRNGRRGAFFSGVWHCDCDPRLPAEKFQTKNGGKNHGRWFFTCQKPQPKRCSFFLWSDDAKVREESAVINNSRSEPNIIPEPKTPKKQTKLDQPLTPVSKARSSTLSLEQPKTWISRPTLEEIDHEESFAWSSSGDEELANVAEAVTKHHEGLTDITAQDDILESPNKRTFSEMIRSNRPSEKRSTSEDVFTTSTTPTKTNGLLSPGDSQSKQLGEPMTLNMTSSIAVDVMDVLKRVELPQQVEQDLVELLQRHDLRVQGIAKGRDITRVAIHTKDKKIAELQARINALEAEKETSRVVIAHLKQDIATSPKRMGRSRFGNRSEV